MSKKTKNLYDEVANGNEGVEPNQVRSVFIWYDLLSFALSFQLIFILAYSIGLNFAVTMLSVVFIIITDSVLKVALEKDNKNFLKFKSQMALVKLWTIPLIVLGAVTSGALIVVTFGLI